MERDKLIAQEICTQIKGNLVWKVSVGYFPWDVFLGRENKGRINKTTSRLDSSDLEIKEQSEGTYTFGGISHVQVWQVIFIGWLKHKQTKKLLPH